MARRMKRCKVCNAWINDPHIKLASEIIGAEQMPMCCDCAKKARNPFAHRLRELRESAGLSITDLAAIAGVTYQAIRFLELGKREPSLATARKLAEALGRRLECWE